jgi:mannitol/fructose-specific phosphotransferase system IIA component (Ntr-type)
VKFAQYLHEELIFLNMPCGSKEKTITYLAQELCKYYKLSYLDEVLQDVHSREKIKSTGLGKGLAIPHGRVESADRLYIAFGLCEKGIEWDSVDDEDVHYIFFIIGPSKLENEYLEALGDISRIMIRHDIKEGIHHAKSAQEVIDLIKESGIRHGNRDKEGAE